jgi:hypothetical protein
MIAYISGLGIVCLRDEAYYGDVDVSTEISGAGPEENLVMVGWIVLLTPDTHVQCQHQRNKRLSRRFLLLGSGIRLLSQRWDDLTADKEYEVDCCLPNRPRRAKELAGDRAKGHCCRRYRRGID